MVGGGQLARMTHQSAIALGQSLRVLAVSPDDPAAQVSPDVVIGSHTDLEALRRAAAGADALTFDHEHVPTELLHMLVAEGVPVPLAKLDGLDSLLSIVQMPAGVPVATVSIGGARNAGLLAVRILGSADAVLRARMTAFQADLEAQVLAKARALRERLLGE